MRIDIIRPRLYTAQAAQKPKSAQVSLPVTTTGKSKILPNFGYFVSFNGYSEDKAFITSTRQALKNTMQRVVDYYDEDNYEFQDALETLEKNDIETYKKLISSKNDFKSYGERFEHFNQTTLNSIKYVQYGKAHFSEYWIENSHIGNKKNCRNY